MSSPFSTQPFYHETIKRFVSAFGQLFSGITIINRDANCNVISNIRVPIAYGPKNKWLERLRAEPDLNSPHVKVTMPRISFEITDYRYDAVRKIGTVGNFVSGFVGDKGVKLFNPVPYDVIVRMYSYAKDNDTSMQILEQVLPYFAPVLEISFEQLPSLKVMKKVPIMLDGVAVDDNYDDNSTNQRTIIQTFSFTAKLDFFGPIYTTDKFIKKTIVDVGRDPEALDTQHISEAIKQDDGSYGVVEGWQDI